MNTKIITLILLCFLAPVKSDTISATQEKPEFIKKMLEAVGGIETWAAAAGFRMLEIAHFGGIKTPFVREYWVDFDQPRIKEFARGNMRLQTSVLNLNEGWTEKDQEINAWESDQVKGWQIVGQVFQPEFFTSWHQTILH